MAKAITKTLIKELGFDPVALRAKYRKERDKRLRADGNDQYQEIKGDFSHYVDDPYVAPGFTREPHRDDVEVIVIGGGFGGLLASARLHQAGITDFRIIEKGGDFGGTWYWNRYPGAACDIESYIYLPLLEETGFMPKDKYSPATEIFAYCKSIGEKFDLYSRTCFQTGVTALHWNDEAALWTIQTDQHDQMRAKFVIMANGGLNRPKLPGIPGIGDFKGHTFHTSRWDYAYTGGSPEGKLDGLRDKRVGIIGTGATAIQCVPHVGAAARQLYVFQRTPSSVGVRANRPTDPEWAASLESGWQKRRTENFDAILAGRPQDEDLVNDGWTESIRELIIGPKARSKTLSRSEFVQQLEWADFRQMEKIRNRVDSIVNDPATAESLKPYYQLFCKRPCFHDEYLDTFNRPNVSIVDTDGKGVEQITETGVIVDGIEYEVDCLIFATGFEVGTDYTRRSGYDLTGRGGQSLADKWQNNGLSTLHGATTHGFPNCLIVQNPQSTLSANFPQHLNEMAEHFAYIISRCKSEGISTIEPTQEAEDDWVETIVKLSRLNETFQSECTPGYYNNEGKPNINVQRNSPYGKGSAAYFNLLAEWRDEGSMPGFEITYDQ